MREQMETQQYLTFSVGGEEYAMRILSVREILLYGAVTTVPKAAPWIRGVTNVRGSVVPVVDLGTKLGVGDTTPTLSTRIIVVDASIDGETTTIGLMADSVTQVIDLGAADIEPPPTLGTHIDSSYLVGVGRTGGAKFVLLLDIDAVLTRGDAAHVAEVADDAQPADEGADAQQADEAAATEAV